MVWNDVHFWWCSQVHINGTLKCISCTTLCSSAQPHFSVTHTPLILILQMKIYKICVQDVFHQYSIYQLTAWKFECIKKNGMNGDTWDVWQFMSGRWNVRSCFQDCSDCSRWNFMYWNQEHRITTKDYDKTKSPVQPKNISRLIFIEMSIDALFRWWHQRAECHIFCRWDWAATRGLVANTIEECKHTEGHERPINGSSLGLINYPKKETEVW